LNFDKLFKTMVKAEIEQEPRKPEIRTSSMPFCPIKYVLSYSDNENSFSYKFDFYVSIGTIGHEVVQRWFPIANPNLMFGNWYCRRCRRTITMTTGPVECPGCHERMEYKELSLHIPDAPATGHCDGIIFEKEVEPFSEIKKVDAWVLELKTTSRWGCMNLTAPYLGADLQATMYVSTLRKIFKKIDYGIDINFKGYIIKYFARDNPDISSKAFMKEIEGDFLYDKTVKLISKLYKGIREDKPNIVFKTKPCQSGKKSGKIYAECPYADFCNLELNKKEFKEIWNDHYKTIRKDLLIKDTKLFI
jgi:hypothetical protein